MATTDSTPIFSSLRLHRKQLLGVAAVLAPLSYLAGRLNWGIFAQGWFMSLALGVMAGTSIGLFFGALKSPAATATSPNTLDMEHSILEQLKTELTENQALFEARKGSTTMFARIEYITAFWSSIKASGRLFVMQDAALLGSIGAAYFWLAQATHLETLAYEAKYTTRPVDGPAVAERLINEARLLDGQLEGALTNALAAINTALGA